MASVLPAERAFLLSLIFACFQFSIGGLLKGSVTCVDCSPLYDLSGIRIGVNCSKEELLSYALTDTEGQFQILISKPSLLPPDCSVNLLGGKTQLCGLKKSIISKIIAINSLNKSSNSSNYSIETPLVFFTSCEKIIEKAKVEKKNGGGPYLGEEKPPAESLGLPPLPPLIYLFPFIPIIGIP